MTEVIRNGLSSFVRFMNHPPVKEGFKNIASAVAFTFGIIEAYDIYQIGCGREISTEKHLESPKWVQVVSKIVLVCAKISLVLSGVVSRPGVFIISNLLGAIFSTGQLESVFGPNTVFALNPWHPRHVISIAAVILALPSVVQSVYNCFQYQAVKNNGDEDQWLTDQKVRLMAFFNTLVSRPIQHLGNKLCKAMITAL